MRACATDKHPSQRFGHFRFIGVVAVEHLSVKRSFPISGNLQILNTPSGSHEVTGVGTIAIASAIGSTFSPRGSNTLLQFFTHDLFNQDLDGTHSKTTEMLTKLLLFGQDVFRR